MKTYGQAVTVNGPYVLVEARHGTILTNRCDEFIGYELIECRRVATKSSTRNFIRWPHAESNSESTTSNAPRSTGAHTVSWKPRRLLVGGSMSSGVASE